MRAQTAFWSGGSDPIRVHRGKADGTFQAPQIQPFKDSLFGLTVGDLDGDGLPDLVGMPLATKVGMLVVRQDAGILIGRGDGAFFPMQTFPQAKPITSVLVGDFDANGKDDLAVAFEDSDELVGELNVTP